MILTLISIHRVPLYLSHHRMARATTPRPLRKSKVVVLYREIGESIATIRDRKGLTQEELATKTGFSRASIANVERGMQKVPLHRYVDIANALGVKPQRILAPVG